MATSQSWIEQMQQLKKQSTQEGDIETDAKPCTFPETPGRVLHWLLKAAMPEWTSKELKTTKTKFKDVGIDCCSDLEDALQEKGELNQRLRDKNLKAFGVPTLTRFRNQLKTHRERQRMQFLLDERRRIDLERKANPEQLPASSSQSTADGQEETDSLSDPEGTGSPGVPAFANAEDHPELADSVATEEDLTTVDTAECSSKDEEEEEEVEEEGKDSADASTSAIQYEEDGLETSDAAPAEGDLAVLGEEVATEPVDLDQDAEASPETLTHTDEDAVAAEADVVQADTASVEAKSVTATAIDCSADAEANDAEDNHEEDSAGVAANSVTTTAIDKSADAANNDTEDVPNCSDEEEF